jgi:TetR/AcrR family transcriptional repressor of nem operon
MMVIMRYAPEHKDEVRARIVREASEAFRARGLDGIAIPELMRRVGLTHGAFYVHFPSRDALVAAAVTHASEDTGQRVFGAAADLEGLLGTYLSEGHLEHPERGCVIAALGIGTGRQSPTVRRAFARAAHGLLRLVQRKLRPHQPGAALSDEALRVGATMVGAVVLSRLVEDEALAARLLRAARTVSTTHN